MPMDTSIKTIEEYIKNSPKEIQSKLKDILKAVRGSVPKKDTIESISYGMPAFKYLKKPLFYFAGFKTHLGIYPISPEMKKFFKKDLEKYDGMETKGTIRLPIDKAIPSGLIKKLVKYKVKEILELVNKKK